MGVGSGSKLESALDKLGMNKRKLSEGQYKFNEFFTAAGRKIKKSPGKNTREIK